jgi:hypothetical protein
MGETSKRDGAEPRGSLAETLGVILLGGAASFGAYFAMYAFR